jgi:DNA polymerase III subunit delta
VKLAGPKAQAFCQRPPKDVRIALLFGSDGGLVSEAADTLARAWVPDIDPFNLVRLADEDLRRDPARLEDELVARSLLGGDRIVRLRIERETAAGPVLALLKQVESNAFLSEAAFLIEAGDLGKKSDLRAAFEIAGKAAALHFYPDDEASILDLVRERLARAGVAIEPDALALFSADLAGDRRLALAEIEKLELYALDLGRPVGPADIAGIASAEQPMGADDAADAVILGDVVAADRALNRFFDAGGSAISALRTLHFRLVRVTDATASGAASGMRLRPPVFDRDWPQFSRALRDWTPARIRRALARLYETELACKQAGVPAEALVSQLVLRLATRSG